MSTTATPPTAPVAERPATAKLVHPRPEALKFLRTAMDKGAEIKAMRIRNGDELDAARARKLEWVQEVTDLLNKLFDNNTVADYVNDWVGKVFPEYAEFGNFVEQFYEEMDYRLGKLRTVVRRIEAAEGGAEAAAAPGEPSPGATPAPRIHKSSSHADAPSSANAIRGGNILFVSHGPKDPSSEAVLQFMQQMSLPVVEADHTNGLIDTLEGRNDMCFVVVMNVADTVENGKAGLSESSIFKLGYCAGKLGIKRMCMMHGPTQPQVNDGQGIAHVPVDVNGGWQIHLARQMRRAGMDVDMNRLA